MPTPTEAKPDEGGHRSGGTNRIWVLVMLGVPLLFSILIVWVPAMASIGLSFTEWNGLGGLGAAEPVGGANYERLATNYPTFWPALQHNVTWLVFFMCIATPLGLLLAVMLDKDIRGSRFYQSAIFLPVVLSLALVGFIWQLLYSRDNGLINALTGGSTDWIGNSDINLWAAMVAASWRHVGYVMVIYLAGLKGIDPIMREAASVDGANEVQIFRYVTFPGLRPAHIVVMVITAIEALRAFDLVYVLNRGRNGLELLSILVTENIIGEATRIGLGSAIATVLLVISLAVIIPYLVVALREQAR